MIRLSPKALRFAEKAAWLVVRRPVAGQPDAIAAAWSSGSDLHPPARTPSASKYVKITDREGAIFLDALDTVIPMLEAAGDKDFDPDIENDLAFLGTIRAELKSRLRQSVNARSN